LSFQQLCGPVLINKIEGCLLAQGLSFEEMQGEIEFDKELENLFDPDSKKIIRTIVKSNIINT